MKVRIDEEIEIDLNSPLDISIPIQPKGNNLTAFYVEQPRFEPVMENGFIGSVEKGGNVNFKNVFFNPHGHGTHTECLGHITKAFYSVNDCLKKYFFQAQLMTVHPTKKDNGDFVIEKSQIEGKLEKGRCEALILRTLPNEDNKKEKQYSGTNPPYIDITLIPLLEEAGVKHLLVDLPSVDREEDGGKLAFHHAFWQVPENPQLDKTITELIYVNDSIKDGRYILNLQVAPFENDAAPSRPVLFITDDL